VTRPGGHTPASPAEIEAAWSDSKLANVLYHDWEAQTYDQKWSISFDQRCIDYARDRFEHVAGRERWPYGAALEVGCGTAFFILNLLLAGVIDSAPGTGHVTDVSPGMVEAACRSAESLGFQVAGRVADAERLPFDDATFELVVGHAVLHHIPDVEQALREVVRVLKPGGRFVFAGEPTRWGDIIARRLSRATWWAATHATRLHGLEAWRRPRSELDESSRAAALEAVVDLHTFVPAELRRIALRAGAVDVAVRTEELTSAWLGWPVRTFEHAVPREKLGFRWAKFAYTSWRRLSAIDRLLESVIPPGLFYNAEVTGFRPDG
jgi:SAM-dependent methyltransferase